MTYRSPLSRDAFPSWVTNPALELPGTTVAWAMEGPPLPPDFDPKTTRIPKGTRLVQTSGELVGRRVVVLGDDGPADDPPAWTAFPERWTPRVLFERFGGGGRAFFKMDRRRFVQLFEPIRPAPDLIAP